MRAARFHFDGSGLSRIGPLGAFRRSDDAGVSFTVWRRRCSFGTRCTTDRSVLSSRKDDMCRGSNVKDAKAWRDGGSTGVRQRAQVAKRWRKGGAFQLESLILAQNERWRQA